MIKNLFKKHKNIIYWGLFSIIVAMIIFLQYYGLVHFRYPVPPGDDPMNHYNTILSVKDKGFFNTFLSGSYPPGYHWLIGGIADLFKKDPFQVMLWTYPAILILTSLSIFISTYFLFGKKPAMIAIVIYFFASRTPLQSLNDGNYPNLLAAQFLLPLFILSLTNIFRSVGRKRIYWGLGTLVGFFLIIFAHHITTFYLLTLLAVVTPILIIYYWRLSKWRPILGWSLIATYFLLLSAAFLAYLNLEIFASARNLAGSMITFSANYPFVKISESVSSAIWTLPSLIVHIGRLPIIFGLLAAVSLPIIFRKEKNKIIPIIIVSALAIILLIGSQLSFLSNPERLARDLVPSLAILGSVLIIYFFEYRNNLFIKILVIVIVIAFGFSAARDRVKLSINYEPMVRLTSADMKVLDYLNKQKPHPIMLNTYNPYLPMHLKEWYMGNNISETIPNIGLMYFDYIYVQNSATGWYPPEVHFGMAETYLANPDIITLLHETTATSEVYLFRIIHRNPIP